MNRQTKNYSVVFIDSRITGYQKLLAGIAPGTEIVLLSSAEDGLAQIDAFLNGRSDLDAIHLISHGSAGALYLGSTVLDIASLPNYTDALSGLGQSLSQTGDLLLYGCNVASGDAGLSFITRLSELTGADVAASTNLTGAAALGGNAALEATTGAIEAATTLSAATLAELNSVLGTAPVLANVAPTAAYTENATGTILAPALTVSDVDSATLISATVTISAGFVAGDALSANVAGTSITASYNAANHGLLLSGTDSLVHYQQVLNSVKFSSASDNPTYFGASPTRMIDWQVNDGTPLVGLLYGTPTTFGAGSQPRSVAIADVNGDGKLDLAVANEGGYADGNGNVSVLLGNGDGTFAAATNFAVGTDPIYVAIGDLNGDGKLDIAAADLFSANVLVLLGNGDGMFTTAANFAVGTAPLSVAIGDLNGDGKLDLAAPSLRSSNVSVLLGNGDGTFQNRQDFGITGTQSAFVAIADLNGDGKLDLVVANQGFVVLPRSDGSVSVLLGDGNGTFAAATNFATGAFTQSTAIADVNGDGKLDLAAANNFSNDVSVLLGNGDGTFAAATKFAVGTSPRFVSIGDLNGDGRLDLATANSSGTVAVLLGNGDGTFQNRQDFGAGSILSCVAIADLNGDGKLDLAIADQGSNNVSVLLNASTNFSAIQHTTLTITAVNDAPTLANPIADRRATQTNDPFSFTVNANTFADDSILTYSATLDNGSPLPAWLAFDANSRTFSGTPLVGDIGNLAIKVIATDGVHPSVSDIFILPVIGQINDAPNGADKTVIMPKNTAYSLTVADFGFSDPNDTPANSLLAVKIDTLPVHGTLTDNGIAVSAGQFIPVADIAAGLLKFAPVANTTGTGYASFNFQVQDNGGTANEGIDLDPTFNILTINVTGDGSSSGDPHLVTFDGLAYDFQATGDFVLVRALDSDLEIQVRHAPYSPIPGSTVITELATVVDGNEVVFDVNKPQPFVNGDAFALAMGESRSLGEGTLSHASIADGQGDLYTLSYANGDQLLVQNCGNIFINTTVYLSGSKEVVGLLGNNNGQSVDDLALRDGTILDNPLAPEHLYGDFAKNWQVTSEESLFTDIVSPPVVLIGNAGDHVLTDIFVN